MLRGVFSIFAILAAIITVFVFVTGIPSVPSVFGKNTVQNDTSYSPGDVEIILYEYLADKNFDTIRFVAEHKATQDNYCFVLREKYCDDIFKSYDVFYSGLEEGVKDIGWYTEIERFHVTSYRRDDLLKKLENFADENKRTDGEDYFYQNLRARINIIRANSYIFDVDIVTSAPFKLSSNEESILLIPFINFVVGFDKRGELFILDASFLNDENFTFFHEDKDEEGDK